MIQRIQSVYLFLAGLCGLAGIKLPFFIGTDPKGIPSSTLEASDGMELLAATIVVAALAFVTIFLFRNRSLQLKLAIGALFVQLLLIFFYLRDANAYLSGTYALTCILQALVVMFIVLAIIGINRDNKIIRDSNRLR